MTPLKFFGVLFMSKKRRKHDYAGLLKYKHMLENGCSINSIIAVRKLQHPPNYMSAVPIKRSCGCPFLKASPPCQNSVSWSGGERSLSASIFILSESGFSRNAMKST